METSSSTGVVGGVSRINSLIYYIEKHNNKGTSDLTQIRIIIAYTAIIMKITN